MVQSLPVELAVLGQRLETEDVANAVRHGRVRGREIETRFLRLPDAVRIEVHDASEKRPMVALPDDSAEGGWGLLLVEVLSAKWGVSGRRGVGKVVWAELPAPTEGSSCHTDASVGDA
ncbi:hypothetical protein GCM10017752_41190 [Streptomyces roseoviridis]